jgi:hypothetical protein
MRRLLVVLAASVFLFAGCGLFGDDAGIRIDLPDQTFDFELNADDLVTALEAELGVSLDGEVNIPPQLNLTKTFDFELPPEKIDLTDEDQLKDYIAAGKIKKVVIRYIQYNFSQNTLNYPLPGFEMFVDAFEATGITTSSDKVAETNEITVGLDGGPFEVIFSPNGRDILSEYFMSLKFAFLASGEVTIDTSQSRAIPSGRLAGTIVVGLYFTVDPL